MRTAASDIRFRMWLLTSVPFLSIIALQAVNDVVAGAFGLVAYIAGSVVTFTATRVK